MLFVITAFTLTNPYGVSQQAEEVTQAARSTEQTLDVQQDLPSESHAQTASDEDGKTTTAILPKLPETPPASEQIQHQGPPWGTLLRMLGWMIGICAVVFFVTWISDAIPGLRRPFAGEPSSGSENVNSVVSAVQPGEILLTADALAAAGQYSEAMHYILLDSVRMLRRRFDAEISDSLTSRELLKTLALPYAEYGAIQDIVSRVEQTWFRDRRAGPRDYEAVRDSFRVFVPALVSKEA